ncbi:uncharacterized protein LOC135844958 isoform X2 [Planococcus citri]|uniref:uncharacterized protein LOC135844958 isoform X2 n=1 Tax=Planococcus citri TaxID=170843 RepID=UPI0031F78D2E
MEVDEAFQANPPRSRPFSFLRGEQSLSLRMLAATKYALMLWRDKYYNPDHDGHPVWIAAPIGLPNIRPENIAIKAPIKAIIDDRILTIGVEIKMWESNFRAAVTGRCVVSLGHESLLYVRLFRPGPNDLPKCPVSNKNHVDILVKGFDNIVCNPDGTICFQRSVGNLLMKEELLDPVIRFRIACTFCVEEQIMQIWPSVNQIPNIFDDSLLMQYWRNDLNNVAVSNRVPTILAGVLVDLANNRNWAAFEYLWGKTTEPNQISASEMIIAENDFYLMKRLLLNLSEELFQNVCLKFGDRIFSHFVTHPIYYKYAIDSWACMKNDISGEIFVKIVHKLWELVFNPSESQLTRVNQNSSLLAAVWTDATDPLKSNVSETNLFMRLDGIVRGVHHYDLKFMFELLANISNPSKKKIWINKWPRLMIRSRPSDLEKLMKLCLVNDDEIEKFKQSTAANIYKMLNHSYLKDFFEKGLYSDLSDYLNFFVKNPRRLENLSREMILSNLDLLASYNENEATQCHLFIRSTFRDAEKADQFIKGMISSPECLGWIYCKLDDCCFDKVVNLSRRFPSNNKNFNEMKEEFLIYCHRNFARGQISGFHEQNFTEFVSWCGVGGEKLSKFKKTLIIVDDVFEISLNNFLREASKRPHFEPTEQLRLMASYDGLREASKWPRYVPTEQLLTPFDNFLRWYFGSSEAAKNYKFVKLTKFHEWQGVMNALQTADSECVEKFLKWGFENDENEVQKLKSRLS